MKILNIAAIALAIMLCSAEARAAAVGKVEEVQGEVTLTREKDSHAVKAGEAVEEHDVLEIADKSRVRVVFNDETEVVAAGKGKFSVDEYIYDAKQPAGNKASFGVLGVAFSYVGGLMEKKDANVNLNLDFGSIGIRGTKIYRTMHNNECWIYVERGSVSVKNKGGAINLKSGQGTILTAQTKAPAPPHIWSDKEIAFIKGAVANPWLHKKDWK